MVSTLATQPPMIADDLRRQADVFIDLRELQPKIRREPAPRGPIIRDWPDADLLEGLLLCPPVRGKRTRCAHRELFRV
jgi:hypothetical protein